MKNKKDNFEVVMLFSYAAFAVFVIGGFTFTFCNSFKTGLALALLCSITVVSIPFAGYSDIAGYPKGPLRRLFIIISEILCVVTFVSIITSIIISKRFDQDSLSGGLMMLLVCITNLSVIRETEGKKIKK